MHMGNIKSDTCSTILPQRSAILPQRSTILPQQQQQQQVRMIHARMLPTAAASESPTTRLLLRMLSQTRTMTSSPQARSRLRRRILPMPAA